MVSRQRRASASATHTPRPPQCGMTSAAKGGSEPSRDARIPPWTRSALTPGASASRSTCASSPAAGCSSSTTAAASSRTSRSSSRAGPSGCGSACRACRWRSACPSSAACCSASRSTCGCRGSAVAARDGELVRYKPGRRAVFRYPGAYGKLRADEAGAAHVAVARELIAQGIRTPAPIEYRPELGMALYEEVRGTRLATLRGGGLERWMEPVAATLAQLQPRRSPPCGSTRWRPSWPTCAPRPRPPPRSAPTPRDLADELARRLDRARAAAADDDPRQLPRRPGARRATASRSWISTAPRAATRGSTSATSPPTSPPRARTPRASASCTRAAPAPEVLLFEAAALLRWSSLPFRDLEPGWRAAVAHRRRARASAARELGDHGLVDAGAVALLADRACWR